MEMNCVVEHGLCGLGEKFLATLSNSERAIIVEIGSEGTGVSLVSARERTQPEVKAPKC